VGPLPPADLLRALADGDRDERVARVLRGLDEVDLRRRAAHGRLVCGEVDHGVLDPGDRLQRPLDAHRARRAGHAFDAERPTARGPGHAVAAREPGQRPGEIGEDLDEPFEQGLPRTDLGVELEDQRARRLVGRGVQHARLGDQGGAQRRARLGGAEQLGDAQPNAAL
jgi:hypothetical protein